MREECHIEFSVYADVEALLRKIYECKYISELSHPTKVSKNTLYFYSIMENTQNKVR